MMRQKHIRTIIFLCLCFIFHVTVADEACDISKCKGPHKYYQSLRCIPNYSSEDSCCPVSYNCEHLQGRARDKCHYKGHVYEIGQSLRAEDAKPCDKSCHCAPGLSGAQFRCAVVDCFQSPGPGCYLKKAHDKCCSGPEVCPGRDSDIARCEVDGKTYLDGQGFTPSSDPTKSCICGAGYTGENVAPFCKPIEPYLCNVELHDATNIYNNCTPVFYSRQNPATDCNLFSRCQNKNDRVVESADTTETGVSDPSSTCIFGDLTMKKGDELNSGTHYDSVCVKCVCEIPPIPTCQRLPDSVCDVTVHDNFDGTSK